MGNAAHIGTNIDRHDRAIRYQGASKQPAQFRLCYGIVAIALACGLTAVAQQTNHADSDFQRRQNILACGYNTGICNERLLSPAEAAQVLAIQHRQNVLACGYETGPCNEGLLSPSEAAQVNAIRHRQNVLACGYDTGPCDEALLSNTEASQVLAVRHRQNALACRYGLGQCDEARLTPHETAIARPAKIEDECIANPNLLPSAVKKTEVAPTSFDSMLNALLNALFAPAGTPVAENGSYYGEPNKSGVPKTVLVNGYRRSNGTYVQGYYRSAPGTNP